MTPGQAIYIQPNVDLNALTSPASAISFGHNPVMIILDLVAPGKGDPDPTESPCASATTTNNGWQASIILFLKGFHFPPISDALRRRFRLEEKHHHTRHADRSHRGTSNGQRREHARSTILTLIVVLILIILLIPILRVLAVFGVAVVALIALVVIVVRVVVRAA